MKNLILKLSNNSEFFNEKRFVFRGEKPLRTIASAQKEPKDVNSMSRAEVAKAYEGLDSKKYIRDARKLCGSSKKACNRLRRREQKIFKREKAFRDKGDYGEQLAVKDSKTEIKRLMKLDTQVPGYQKLFDALRFKIADAGLKKVTDKEVNAYIKQWKKDNPGHRLDSSKTEVKRILTYNRREKAAKDVGNFLKRNKKYLDQVIVSLYVYLVKFKERDNAQKVMTAVKNKVIRNRRLLAYLPNLKKKPTAVAARPKPKPGQ